MLNVRGRNGLKICKRDDIEVRRLAIYHMKRLTIAITSLNAIKELVHTLVALSELKATIRAVKVQTQANIDGIHELQG